MAINWHDLIVEKFQNKSWDIGAYYSAIFDWSSIQAAFLFGVYAFFLSRSEPFLQAIGGTPVFKQLRQYVVRSLYLSLTLSVLTLPVLVSPPEMKSGNLIGFIVFWFLSTLLTYTFFCFLKVVRVFGKIERMG